MEHEQIIYKGYFFSYATNFFKKKFTFLCLLVATPMMWVSEEDMVAADKM
jgi:hypothetical protein